MDDLENWFTYHPPRDDRQVQRYQELRSSGCRLAEDILEYCPPGPDRDLAIAKVREAVMWANAGIACGEQP